MMRSEPVAAISPRVSKGKTSSRQATKLRSDYWKSNRSWGSPSAASLYSW
jgi:hypothetical protein